MFNDKPIPFVNPIGIESDPGLQELVRYILYKHVYKIGEKSHRLFEKLPEAAQKMHVGTSFIKWFAIKGYDVYGYLPPNPNYELETPFLNMGL